MPQAAEVEPDISESNRALFEMMESTIRAEVLQEYDPLHKTRWILDQISKGAEMPEYCGLPMPVEGENLIVEPRHPAIDLFKDQAEKAYLATSTPQDREYDEHVDIVNTFYSRKKRCHVTIWKDRRTGKYDWGLSPAVHHFTQDLSTMGCSSVWSMDAEVKAQELLLSLVNPYKMRCYLLTGMFMETSERSGVTYVFRRLRPTVALRGNRILTALCMHPIGYYEGTWAGSMVPTDDVVAHLLLMRSDEHMFWRRSNQHPAWSNLAGL